MTTILVQISTSFLQYSNRSIEPQLGLYYIASWLDKKGFDTKIKHFESSSPILRPLLKIIDDYSCNFLGFYVDSENVWFLRRIICAVKELRPNLTVVIGGPQVTGNPQLALDRTLMSDIAIIGEGETIWEKLLSAPSLDNDILSKIENIAYRLNGEIHITNYKQSAIDINELGFPIRQRYSLDEDNEYKSLITGRGCIGRCAFCYEGSKKHNPLRLRSVESIIEEFDYLVSSSKKKYLAFLDDTFIINPKRTERICNELISKYHGDVKWFCEARCEILLRNAHLIPLLKKAGLIRVQLGGESGNQNVLDCYNKGIKLEQIESVVDLLYKNQIPSIYINFIVGGAIESIDTFKDTLEFAKKMMRKAPGCVEVGASLFTPYVGTPMYISPHQYGINIIDKELIRGADGSIPFAESKELSQYKIAQLYDIFNAEIDQTFIEILAELPHETILKHFILDTNYDANTLWGRKIVEVEKLKNYYESIISNKYVDFEHIQKDSFEYAIPFRTILPLSNGNNYHYIDNFGNYIPLHGFEESVFLLSSGKLNIAEIKRILQQKYEFGNNLSDELCKVYEKFNKEHLIIWKTLL